MGNFINVVGKWGKKVVLGLAGAGLAICLASGTASAQSKFDAFGGYSYGTNSFTFNCDISFCDPGLHGYGGSFGYNFTPHVALEAAFTGHLGTPTTDSRPASATVNGFADTADQHLYTYTFGPRLSVPTGNFNLFTHFLVGAGHLSENATETCFQSNGDGECFSTEKGTFKGSGFMMKTGGGVDWNHGGWGLRLLEVDYVHSQFPVTESFTGDSEGPQTFQATGNMFELVTGITFHFGGSVK
jgi:hypothetical protein